MLFPLGGKLFMRQRVRLRRQTLVEEGHLTTGGDAALQKGFDNAKGR